MVWRDREEEGGMVWRDREKGGIVVLKRLRLIKNQAIQR